MWRRWWGGNHFNVIIIFYPIFGESYANNEMKIIWKAWQKWPIELFLYTINVHMGFTVVNGL